jgi:flagellar motor switch protein FliN/FliY
MTSSNPSATPQLRELASGAAVAAAAVLPAAEPPVAGVATTGDPAALAAYAGAAVVDLQIPGAPVLALVVGSDLVGALAESPIGPLSIADAVQPALDAAAGFLGAGSGPAREIDVAVVAAELGPFVLVPLGEAAALLVPDAALVVPEANEPTAESPFVVLPPAAGAPAETGVLPSAPAAQRRGLELLHGVDMEVTVELGRTRMTVRDLLSLAPGAVLELDRAAGSPADLLVNGRLIARGEVVVVDENFGLRVTEIVEESVAS